MPRQLTPEENRIIRRTEKEGAELAEKEQTAGNKRGVARHQIMGLVVFALIFILLVYIGHLIVGNTSGK